MKYSVLIIAFNFLFVAASATIAQEAATNVKYNINVPSGTADYKNGYADGFIEGAKQADLEGLENHKKRLEKAEANRRQAVEAARLRSSN